MYRQKQNFMKIVYNANGKEEVVALEGPESSTLFSSGAPKKRKLNRFGLIYVFFMRKASSKPAKTLKGYFSSDLRYLAGVTPYLALKAFIK